MPWPPHIRRKSDRLTDTENIENKFYPLYDDILNECFPRDRFSICPQYATPLAQTGGIGAINFTISYAIEALDLDSVVFFVEIKPPTHLHVQYARKEANNQMRQRFLEISHLARVPKLYGISAIGRRVYYYAYNKATGAIESAAIHDSSAYVVDTAPTERWDSDIMEEEGRDRFLEVVREIQNMVDAL
ncbi:hypothetical protein K435DRAFT_730322 [Dendrothele bispora CBS 962.96]|uniref:Fungal-type protein kinase domain-containing protein n=1 Tax=Dendrothele bispora (strain CBS 962.96) TaxID=1314807 RepID=A0A4S8LG18_DENBC|nr:hypothetical protein K435DRAFT_730322 [Dendrothele bispora CBS 962.96]